MPDDNDNSGDCSSSNDEDINRPSCNNGAGRGSSRKTDQIDRKKRRIVMRIEFDDSDDDGEESDDASSSVASNGNVADLDTRPSCSTGAPARQRRSTRVVSKKKQPAADSDSDSLERISARQLRSRRGANRLQFDDEWEDSISSSGSEIAQCTNTRRRGKKQKKFIISDDEVPANETNGAVVDGGFSSDSSSNELLEKCPICLLTFRQQEIGTPATCEHNFCAACIEAWSKNVQTCPIDRLAFDKIIVRDTFGLRNIVREILVDPSKAKKELELDDDNEEGGATFEVTNCEICNSPDREDVMLLCDSCNQGYHMDCLDPPLLEIPEGSWYCDNCFASHDEDMDEQLELAEDLQMLYEDIRGMGLPETRLRVREVQQPRILRTRQNERIRAAVLRHTRSSAAAQLETTTTTQMQTTRRGRGSTTTTTTTTRTTTTQRSASGRTAPSGTTQRRRRRRKRTRYRTYVVEYDLNNFDEKFALKTTRKVIKRRRRRKANRKLSRANTEKGELVRLSASKRLAEQMGVKTDANHSSRLGGAAASFTLFGHANDLEYFSDSDNAGEDVAIPTHVDTGHGTAVQTAVRIASFGSTRNRKALLMGKARTAATVSTPGDILSSIMDMQELWHATTRNLTEVRINADGSLNLPQRTTNSTSNSSTTTEAAKPIEHVTQVPLYQRGGAGPNFGRGGGAGGGSGNYNNRYGGQNNYRGGGGSGSGTGNQYQRHSTGGMSNSGNDSNTGGGNFNNQSGNNSSNNNNSNSQGMPGFTPFNLRFNQRNQQQQQRNQNLSQRQSLPFTPTTPSNTNFSHMIPTQPQPQPQPQLFSGLPAPINHQTPIRMSMPPVLTVPPPPAPPPNLPWNSSLFKINMDYAATNNSSNDNANDDDENCPNYSIYSQESLAVAKATELSMQKANESTKLANPERHMTICPIRQLIYR
ncbi:uncharacterized protein LOC115625553 isoform X2 [Scaptodrosophila lebanonensis]|uniref:Uncharacterized protein LOC115625553 isoform X2 n=1 Tax=Drosophila lebanonensis TaxID=7225 RepID=A0A6J2TIK5_DROLE|nr:uncharacterized protein LOC115625553 isoform X2 [Scaptodrosophila lebanonensis]